MTARDDSPLFVLTVDVEEEWDWESGFPRPPFSTENVKQLPDFQVFCEELGVRPTYFVDYAVAEDPYNCDMLNTFLSAAQCDIGAQMHPWCTSPLCEPIDEFHSHSVNLETKLYTQKLDSLTSLLTRVFAQHPFSYRAGRWGINGQQLRLLASAGYKVDSSVRPYYSDSAFDYSHAPTSPYYPDYNNIQKSDSLQNDILEIPATSGFTRKPFELLNRIHSTLSTSPINKTRLIGALWKMDVIRKVAATPEGNTSKDIRHCIDASIARGDKVINMFFHSSDLLPGCTPYIRVDRDKQQLLQCVRECIAHARDTHNCRFVTIRELPQLLDTTHYTG